ncbi:MobF family relaxase [Dokdonia sp.]|uniref:MobF family relaxase n=1 Tax=Dokdonia sp. TaxID=2024995 RepID=UPI0032639980
MIRMHLSKNVVQAKAYYTKGLSKADYYIQDQEVNGVFDGKIAKRIGLAGMPITKETFNSFCDNIHPVTNQPLTPRTLKDRRVGYDISFHCPKSVSVLYGLTLNQDILETFERSVDLTIHEIENDMLTRIRINNRNRDRRTGEMIWCGFTHLTARPTKDAPPDCHIHCHVYTHNITFDSTENRFKAGQFVEIKRSMPYYQARFLKRLADAYSLMGYGIRKTRTAFELAIIPQKAIHHFSKRTNHIGQVAKEKGITDAKSLDQLGSQTRLGKDKNLTMEQLQKLWQKQLVDNDIRAESEEAITTDVSLTPSRSVTFALNHLLERKSLVQERQVLAKAYHFAIDNRWVSLNSIDLSLLNNDQVFRMNKEHTCFCTTKLVLEEEKQMVRLARQGIGTVQPLGKDLKQVSTKHLNSQQSDAVLHVLQSKNQLTIIKGGAGTGKTTLLKTLVPSIEKGDKQVFLFAPTAEASCNVLRDEGFSNADTLAQLTSNENVQSKIKDQVILIDEAGLIGAKDMVKVLTIANDNNARVILSGDPNQHKSIQRGDAIETLTTIAGIPDAKVTTIFRQKHEEYRQAIEDIAKGNITSGFERLNQFGAIQELPSEDIDKAIVRNYLKARKDKKLTLVITPTRANTKKLNLAIREGLKTNSYLSKRNKKFTVYDSLYLTQSEKNDYRSYEIGQTIQTHQNMKGIKKGSVLTVVDIVNQDILIQDEQGNIHILDINRTKDFDLYQSRAIDLSVKDTIRINKNSFDYKGTRLNNGTTLKVEGFTSKGHIKAVKYSRFKKTSFILDKRFGNFDYAYCSTSYSSQGKTVDNVIIAQPSETFSATSLEQFYVSASRAREDIMIYTDDRERLFNNLRTDFEGEIYISQTFAKL